MYKNNIENKPTNKVCIEKPASDYMLLTIINYNYTFTYVQLLVQIFVIIIMLLLVILWSKWSTIFGGGLVN